MHIRGIRIRHDRYPTREHYPFNLDVLRRTEAVPLTAPVTFFVGENGSGKSTLLRAMADACGIHVWEGMYHTRCTNNPYEHLLHLALEIEWTHDRVPGSFFSAQIFQNFAQVVDSWAAADPRTLNRYGGESLLTQSHGQSLMSYFRARYRIKGIYLLDEPETALSPKTQIALLALLREMSAAGHAQFVIASHSPILLACPGATLYCFDHAPLEPVRYEDTDYYQVYRDFLTHGEKYLDRL